LAPSLGSSFYNFARQILRILSGKVTSRLLL